MTPAEHIFDFEIRDERIYTNIDITKTDQKSGVGVLLVGVDSAYVF